MPLIELQNHIRQTIPLAGAMDLQLVSFDDGRLRMRAPLTPNRNDKGCAFGGSLASLMTLAGWGVVAMTLGDSALQAEIYVQDSQIRYLAPVWEDIEIEAALVADVDSDAFLAAWDRRGRARTSVTATCRLLDGTIASTLEARFVALTSASRVA